MAYAIHENRQLLSLVLHNSVYLKMRNLQVLIDNTTYAIT